MPPTIPRREIDALGRRLIRAAEPSPADLTLLGQLQEEYQRAALVAGETLQPIIEGFAQEEKLTLTMNSRTKTSSTIVDKLRRGTRLSTMQDIFGYRVTGDQPGLEFTLSHQERLGARISEAFPRTRLVDRRANPSAGYRAMHAILDADGFPIEVQIRTHLQDLWANGTESLADAWGRGVRYGMPPEGRDEAEVLARSAVIAANITVADAIYAVEQATDTVVSNAAAIADEVNRMQLPTAEAEEAAAREMVHAYLEGPTSALTAAFTEFRRLWDLVR